MTDRHQDTIFLLTGEGKLARIPEIPYESEDLLQRLIADHPELLGSEQIDPDRPPRWLLITREAGIPDDEDVGSRWSVDHLLLDQDARPTFVEVKRSQDPRVRREVTGQMLEYAANATRFWPADRIRTLAADRHGGPEELDRQLLELGFVEVDDGGYGEDHDDPEGDASGAGAGAAEAIEAYWQSVERNLREGNVRLFFVADHLPRELRRVIEFLNEQMTRAEVLGVEIRQYAGTGGGLKALVPRVVGQSEKTRQQKQAGTRNSKAPLDRDELMQSVPEAAGKLFDEVLREAEDRGFEIRWNPKSFSVLVPGKGTGLLYGYLPTGSWVHPSLSAYIREVEDRAAGEALLGHLESAGWNKRSGQHTSNLALDEQGIDVARRSLAAIWELAEACRQVIE